MWPCSMGSTSTRGQMANLLCLAGGKDLQHLAPRPKVSCFLHHLFTSFYMYITCPPCCGFWMLDPCAGSKVHLWHLILRHLPEMQDEPDKRAAEENSTKGIGILVGWNSGADACAKRTCFCRPMAAGVRACYELLADCQPRVLQVL